MPYTPGPYHAPHLYLQWGGALPGNEQWSCGLRLMSEAIVPAAEDAVAMLPGAAAAVVAYHQSPYLNLSQAAKLSFVKLNHIGIDGRYTQDGTNEATYANLPGAGSAAPIYPNQVTLAVSLTTGFSRGAAHRGRFYLPCPTFGIDGSGLIAASNADAASQATDTFVAALNSLDATWDVAVFSRKLGAATARKVTGNEVGRVYDTQRRRRRSLIEDYR